VTLLLLVFVGVNRCGPSSGPGSAAAPATRITHSTFVRTPMPTPAVPPANSLNWNASHLPNAPVTPSSMPLATARERSVRWLHVTSPPLTCKPNFYRALRVKLAQDFASSRCDDQFADCQELTWEMASKDSPGQALAMASARMWQSALQATHLRRR
jgi:hypothetical protein